MSLSHYNQSLQEPHKNQKALKDKSLGTTPNFKSRLDGKVFVICGNLVSQRFTSLMSKDTRSPTPSSVSIYDTESSSCNDGPDIGNPYSTILYTNVYGNTAPPLTRLNMQHSPVPGSSETQFINPSDVMAWKPLSTRESTDSNYITSTSRLHDMRYIAVEHISACVANTVDFYPDYGWKQPPVLPDTQWLEANDVEMQLDKGIDAETTQRTKSGLPAQLTGQYAQLPVMMDSNSSSAGVRDEAERLKIILMDLTEMENRQRHHTQNQLKLIGDAL
ncbi:hypothetical protein J3458_002108 [Metarhizium acridum]|uniref:uncharacterized protein n=1 Tax=Metarhizium acridum TaxID=92637 RepID=UPI001C6C5C8C|nr:hypothetical protein J3458_002108 [Metarhizium acridum]